MAQIILQNLWLHKMKHNKLVRDKIPDIITRRGDKPVTQILSADAYRRELGRKLQEEVTEFGQSGNVEELADILSRLCFGRG